MKIGDKYIHHKQKEYEFSGIALPIESAQCGLTMKDLTEVGTARYHENTYDLTLYHSNDGVLYVQSDIPFVIYQSEQNYRTDKFWARELDDFFGYTQNSEGAWVKRFTRVIQG